MFKNSRYQLISKLGEGAFSTVYRAVDLYTNHTVALKIITKTNGPSRTASELKHLIKLKGCENVIKLLNIFREDDSVVCVFPVFKPTDFKHFLKTSTINDIKKYMFELLKSINSIHQKKIIHRDIKPANFLYNTSLGKGFLIDFGLAQEVTDNNEDETETGINLSKNTLLSKGKKVQFFSSFIQSNVSTELPGYYQTDDRLPLRANRAGTRGFRAPEVLLRSKEQSLPLDIWSVGVILLILLTKQYPFFKASDDIEALIEIACIFGNREMKVLSAILKRCWLTNINTIPNERICFKSLIEIARADEINEATARDFLCCLDLLDNLLELDQTKRIKASTALKHPFFDEFNNN
ncbi:putative cell division control protein 7 like protein 2 [Cucumispora dikerogammari]|nr:putative cell division control protein 7 like protein 2 [Cucumispora dikerogammari]